MVNINIEMEEIAKLYSLMRNEDKANWTIDEAKTMYDDEIRYCSEHSIDNPLSSIDVLYETIQEFIEQDEEE